MIDKPANRMMDLPYLNRIQHCLMLQSKFVSDVGLMDGKTGIIIAFAHLYERTHNEIHYEYMSELLDDVVLHIYKGLDIGFMSGFSGIGWGIEYLLQNRFIEGKSIEICEEIDRKIMESDPRRISDLSLESGLEGLLHYVLAHIRGNSDTNGQLPFDEMYFSDLYGRVKSLSADNPSSLIKLSTAYIDWYESRSTPNYQLDIMQFVHSPIEDQTSLSNFPSGIKDGLSGLLLKQLFL